MASDADIAPGGPARPTRVLVVDDHVLFAEMLCKAISSEPTFECVGRAQSASDAYEMVAELRPDVVTMDLQMPEVDGIAATAELMALDPDLLVLILTAHAVGSRMNEVRESGAVGVVLKDGSLATVIGAIGGARHGTFQLAPGII
jgi:DNA-binding NarL/FixJ family response regulator